MDRPLAGRVILIIEDEAMIALDLQTTLEGVGAKVMIARTVAAALVEAENPNLSAAIVDHALSDGDSSELCQLLRKRNVPFVVYTGYTELSGACAKGAHVNKPAPPELLVATVQGLLASRPILN